MSPTIQDPQGFTDKVVSGHFYAAAAYNKGDVLKLTQGAGTTAEGVNIAVKSDEDALIGTWFGVVLETTAAAGPIHMLLRGRVEASTAVGTNGTALTTAASWPLMLASEIDDIGNAVGDVSLTPADDMTLDTEVHGTAGYANQRKILAYSLGAQAANGNSLQLCEFNGLEGFGTVTGITALT